MKKSSLLLLLISGLACAGIEQVRAAELEIGTHFPNLTLPSLAEGRPLSIADFRGEKVLLYVWASW